MGGLYLHPGDRALSHPGYHHRHHIKYLNKNKKINNFVEAVEAATDIKKENLAIEREQATKSEEENTTCGGRLRMASKLLIPWLALLGLMALLAYAMITTNKAAS